MALAALGFRLLSRRFGGRGWRAAVRVVVVCWLAVILVGTLGQRTVGEARTGPYLIPFYSYYQVLNGGSRELLRENFMNVALFFPAGLLLCEALPGKGRKLWTIGGLLALSIVIELCQYGLGMGLAETDDVIHNTLGAVLGILACTAERK